MTSTIVEVKPKGSTMDVATWDQVELTVGQLAARSGVAVSALHFYERQGLITSRRTDGNQRRYKRDTLRRIALIRIAARVGIPLADVAAALALLPNGRNPTRADWQRLSQCWQAELDLRMRHLQQLRDDFTDCVGCGCLSIDRCRLANPYDELGRQGAGPRRLLTS
jgi:MerR family transcriptional regulator, redox-sensitive transcriptional activator SoxR